MPSAPEWVIARVEPRDIDTAWPALFGDLKRTFERVKTDLTPSLLYRAGRDGAVSFWLIRDENELAGSISVAHLPDGTGDILTLAGHRASVWVPKLFENWIGQLRVLGLRRLELTGRKGWKRILAPLGFRTEPEDGDLIVMSRML